MKSEVRVTGFAQRHLKRSTATPVSKPILIISAILLLAAPSLGQTHFYLDEPLKRPAKLPDPLLPLLRDDIKAVCQLDAAFQGTYPRKLFSASRIRLYNRRAFMLRAHHHCLTGVDKNWFWIYLQSPRGYRMVLTGGTISLKGVDMKNHMTIAAFNLTILLVLANA